ncbi:preprotein translocase subunit SecG [Candidatus Parcubacteria bacterium]|nr:preprotein translocase subunit SecG [Candidatus Parcubacteria bacterium]
MKEFLSIAQIITAILLIVFILLQQRGTALGSAFGGGGGGGGGEIYSSRRGLQKKLFWATIVVGTLFIVFAILSLAF